MGRTPYLRTLMRAASIALVALALSACGSSSDDTAVATTRTPDASAHAPEPVAQPVAVPMAMASFKGTPCAEIAAIRDPPTMIGNRVDDPAYTALKANAAAAVPCLLDAMVVVEPLDDPQTIPGSADDFTVGDLAFFLLVDFGVVDFAQALPPDVSQATLERGPFAYFDWIVQPGNRERLQARVRKQMEAREAMATVASGR